MKDKKPFILIACILVAAALMFGIYLKNKPEAEPTTGKKHVTVEVVDDTGKVSEYVTDTDAEYLKGLMDELMKTTDFTYEGSISEYGLYINSINKLEAKYDDNGAYWAIYVNGEYGQYGADAQPVNDGDVFRFAYEIYQE